MDINMGTCLLMVALVSGFIQSVTSAVMFNILEEAPVRTFVGSIPSATNFTLNVLSDQIPNLRYNFLSPSTNQILSLGSQDGVLRTFGPIDREMICGSASTCQLSFDVVVRSLIGGFYQQINVVVVIIDINDNAPFFRPSAINLAFNENATNIKIKIEEANDRDIGMNSVQSYELIPSSSPFRLHLSTKLNGDAIVTLELREHLDRERIDMYRLQIRAKDGGLPPLFGTLHVTIFVLDVNDNAPVFLQNEYNISVPTYVRVGTSILQLIAVDRDMGRNGEIFYRFSSQQPNTNLIEIQTFFSIDERSGLIRAIAPLANTHKTSFDIKVEVYDGGSPSLVSQADVFVRIERPTE